MFYLYTIGPDRVLRKATYDDGEHVSHTENGVVEDIARIWSRADGKIYTIDKSPDLHNTCDGKPTSGA